MQPYFLCGQEVHTDTHFLCGQEVIKQTEIVCSAFKHFSNIHYIVTMTTQMDGTQIT